MSKQFETGHAKNLASLFDFNQHIKTLGVTYNPSVATIAAPELEILYTNAKLKLDAVKTQTDKWKVNTNTREVEFGLLNPFSTRLLGVLKSTNASQQTIDDFAALVVKMRGDGKGQKPEAAKPGDGATNVAGLGLTRSRSQQSFDQKLEHFSKMILLLQNVTDYAPNELELSIAGLQKRLADLTAINNAVSATKADLKAARIARNTFFYAADTGVLDLVKKAKGYMLGLYGKTSQQYQAALAIKFTRVVEKREAR